MIQTIQLQEHRSVDPVISVVIPSFNESAEVISQSLASVANQTFQDFECLVIDESTDPQLALACKVACEQDSRFRYIRPQTRLGLGGSLNLGISMAKGEFIARFDSDDVCLMNRFELQVQFMRNHPNVGVLGGGLEIMSEEGNTLAFRAYPQTHAQIERKFQLTTPVAHPTLMIRKEIFGKLGGYDPAFRFSEDLDLWLRFLGHGIEFANLENVLVRYRQQQTRRNSKHWRFNLRARLRNFKFTHLPTRLFGICAIGVWSFLPPIIQEWIFKRLILSRR